MNHESYMSQCLALALKGRGYTAPNPMVGAVLVYNDVVIGEGWHHAYGKDHAEVNCLKSVVKAEKELIPQSIMYVNLEPCAHHGNTPPCAERLVQEGIKEVVIANTDPFEKVSGRGIEILRQGGVQVTTGVLEREGLWLNRRFFNFHTRKRPYIILKWAQTKDGFFAPLTRTRFQITGDYSQLLVHKWRTEEAAIMVGTNTALSDNPQLNARLVKGRQPLRIVLDRKLQLPDTYHVFDGSSPTWIINERQEQRKGNLSYAQLKFDETLLDQLMDRLYASGILSVIVEGGAGLLHSFISRSLWDEARVFTGNVSIGEGIASPELTHSTLAFKTFVERDTLDIFVHQNSPYSYVQGMEI